MEQLGPAALGQDVSSPGREERGRRYSGENIVTGRRGKYTLAAREWSVKRSHGDRGRGECTETAWVNT